jgi:hypothetical protein
MKVTIVLDVDSSVTRASVGRARQHGVIAP